MSFVGKFALLVIYYEKCHGLCFQSWGRGKSLLQILWSASNVNQSSDEHRFLCSIFHRPVFYEKIKGKFNANKTDWSLIDLYRFIHLTFLRLVDQLWNDVSEIVNQIGSNFKSIAADPGQNHYILNGHATEGEIISVRLQVINSGL